MYARTIANALPISHAAALALPSRGYSTFDWDALDLGFMGGILDHIMESVGSHWDEITVHSDGTVQLFAYADVDGADLV